ncbi:MAG: cell division protein FtsZ [Alphaproteobacteria bacterium]|nr:MAG: cell division protein FtsZ [Alphaproteobacteria bacterium]
MKMKKGLDPKIVVLGVGGAGCNAVNNMIKFKKSDFFKMVERSKNKADSDSQKEVSKAASSIKDSKTEPQHSYLDVLSEELDQSGLDDDLDYIDFIVCNTDIQSLNNSPCATKVQLGVKSAQGLGAGSNPDAGKKAAEESLGTIMELLEGANMVIITAGMGGGTGTGAAPVIAQAAKEAGILTLGIVTKPFMFEGTARNATAEAGIEKLEKSVDTLVVVSNQNLHSITSGDTPFQSAFRIADRFLADCIRSVVNIIKTPGLINVDFADLCTVTKNRKNKAMMGSGIASGEHKGARAAVSAMSNLLLDFGDFSWKHVDHVLVCITGGNNLSMDDVTEATQKINDEIASEAHIIVGATFKPEMEDHIQIFIFGTSNADVSKKEIDVNKVSGETRGKFANSIQVQYENNEFIGERHSVNEKTEDYSPHYSKKKWSIMGWLRGKKQDDEVEVKVRPGFLKDKDKK